MARMEWSDPEYADGLLLDQNGFVIEGTMSNVFARFGNQLVTPDLTDSGVDGVTRGRILTMSNSLGLSVSIKPFSLEALLNADEVILCNSLFGAWQVRSLCDKLWPKQALAKKVRDLLES
jgi:4-amino-4-deoxychorismate lyase